MAMNDRRRRVRWTVETLVVAVAVLYVAFGLLVLVWLGVTAL